MAVGGAKLVDIGGIAITDGGRVQPIPRVRPDTILVSSDDTWLSASGGVSFTLLASAGSAIRGEMDEAVAGAGGRLPLGTTVATGPGETGAMEILHATTVDYEEGRAVQGAAAAELVLRTLDHAVALGATRVELPLLGTGAASLSEADFGTALARAVRAHVAGPTALREIALVTAYGPPASVVGALQAARFGAGRPAWSGVVNTRTRPVAEVLRGAGEPGIDAASAALLSRAIEVGLRTLRDQISAEAGADLSDVDWELKAASILLATLPDSPAAHALRQALQAFVVSPKLPPTGVDERLALLRTVRSRYTLVASPVFRDSSMADQGARNTLGIGSAAEAAALLSSSGLLAGGIGLVGLGLTPALGLVPGLGLATVAAVSLKAALRLATRSKAKESNAAKRAERPRAPRETGTRRLTRALAERTKVRPKTTAQIATPELGGTPVGALGRLLAEELEPADFDELLREVDRRDYVGSDAARLAEHLLEISPVEVLRESFTVARLRAVATAHLGLTDAASLSPEECRERLLRHLGFSIRRQPVGLPEHRRKIESLCQRWRTTPGGGGGEVVEAGRRMERALKQLLRFHADHSWSMTPDQLAHGEGWLEADRSVGRASLGTLVWLVTKLDRRLLAADGSEPARRHAREFDGRSLLPRRDWRFVQYRNAAVHDRGAADAPLGDGLDHEQATSFFSETLEWLDHLAAEPMPLVPQVVSVSGIVVDEWGRRRVTAIRGDGVQEVLHTDATLEVGQLYFMHPRSNPVRVFPVLVPAD